MAITQVPAEQRTEHFLAWADALPGHASTGAVALLAEQHSAAAQQLDLPIKAQMSVGDTNADLIGDVVDAAGEVELNDELWVQMCGYAVAPYLSVVGPTLLTVSSEEDLQALERDITGAVHGGSFPSYLTHPQIFVTDLAALGADTAGAGLWVDDEGTIRHGVRGPVLGRTDDPREEVADAFAMSLKARASLNGALNAQRMEAFRESFGKVEWFWNAVAAQRELRARGHEGVEVFGPSALAALYVDMTGAGGDKASPDSALPMEMILARAGDNWYVMRPQAAKTVKISHEAAQLLAQRWAAESPATMSDDVEELIGKLRDAGVMYSTSETVAA